MPSAKILIGILSIAIISVSWTGWNDQRQPITTGYWVSNYHITRLDKGDTLILTSNGRINRDLKFNTNGTVYGWLSPADCKRPPIRQRILWKKGDWDYLGAYELIDDSILLLKLWPYIIRLEPLAKQDEKLRFIVVEKEPMSDVGPDEN